jgi:putative membrane protein
VLPRARLAGAHGFVKAELRCRKKRGSKQTMLSFLLGWLLQGIVILLVARLLPGVRVGGLGSSLIVALVLSILNVFLAPILTFIGTVLTLPAVILTLGLFYFVVRFLVNVFLLRVTTLLVPSFSIKDTSTLMLASLLISLFGMLAARLVA